VKLGRIAGAMIILVIGLMVIVPLVVSAVHELVLPAVGGVGLYVVVRIFNARMNRW
jgi:hypothetical protein